MFYIMSGVFLGSFFIYLLKIQGMFDVAPMDSSSFVEKCSTPPVRGVDSKTASSSAVSTKAGDEYSFVNNLDLVESCLDPEAPLPVILMSLGRSGTDSTWQILKKLTGTTMKAIEIVGGNEEDTIEFFRALEGLNTEANTWAVQEDYDWRLQGGGMKSVRGFYDHIRDFCSGGNCVDGKWIFKWFCDEQQRYKEIGGLVGFKWKAYMSALRTEPAYNALKTVAQLSHSRTPIRVIRSRRNPFDVYLSELKHSSAKDLPDHCHSGDDECIKKHASVRLTVPVDEMYEWLEKTYEEENQVDALLSELGVRTIHVGYDDLYYARSEAEGLAVWNSIFRFLGKKDDWDWEDISGAAGLKPTTKTRSHQALIENFEEVYAKLKDTTLEQFLRF